MSKSGLTAMGNIVDAKELAELTALPQQANASGLHVKISEGQVHSDSGLSDRLGSPSSVSTIDTNGGMSSFETLTRVEGGIAKPAAQVLSGAQKAASDLELFLPDNVRVAEVETRSSGHENSIQRAASLLEQVVSNRGPNDAIPYPSRVHGHGAYARVESGYHSNDYDLSTLWGMGFGYLSRGAWGGRSGANFAGLETDDFGDDKKFLHQRCITRLAQNNSCGGGGLLSHLPPELANKVKDVAQNLEKMGQEAKKLAEKYQEARDSGDEWSAMILRGKLEDKAEDIEEAYKAIEAEVGKYATGDHARHFVGKIRKIAFAKAVVDLLLKIFAGNANKALEEPAKQLVKIGTEKVVQGVSGKIGDEMTKKLNDYAGAKGKELVKNVTESAKKDVLDLAKNAPASALKGQLHAP